MESKRSHGNDGGNTQEEETFVPNKEKGAGFLGYSFNGRNDHPPLKRVTSDPSHHKGHVSATEKGTGVL
jgi:hypothetical protein